MKKMIKWRNHFDFVVVVTSPTRTACVESLKIELDRVGLDVDLFQMGVPTAWEMRLAQFCRPGGMMYSHNKMRNSTIGHFLAIKTARALGKKRILILEDDVRFIKDLSLLRYMVDSIPDKVDVLHMDVIPTRGSEGCAEMFNRGDGAFRQPRWEICPDVRCHSFACVGFNPRGQEWVIGIEKMWTENGRLRPIDAILKPNWTRGGGVTKAIPVPLLARQVSVGNTVFNSRLHAAGCPFDGWYDSIGANRDKYGP